MCIYVYVCIFSHVLYVYIYIYVCIHMLAHFVSLTPSAFWVSPGCLCGSAGYLLAPRGCLLSAFWLGASWVPSLSQFFMPSDPYLNDNQPHGPRFFSRHGHLPHPGSLAKRQERGSHSGSDSCSCHCSTDHTVLEAFLNGNTRFHKHCMSRVHLNPWGSLPFLHWRLYNDTSTLRR